MKKLILSFLMLIALFQAEAQQEAMFTHYSFNTIAVNPGYAGSRDALTVTGLHRSQWIDFPGAPVTQTLTLHAPVANEKIGLGLSFMNDKIGPTKNTSFYVDFAYKIKMGSGKLAFGLKAGGSLMTNDIKDLKAIDDDDQLVLNNGGSSEFLPNFGFGLYYSTEKYYVGISTPRLLENEYSSNAANATAKENRHYYFIAGMVFPINKKKTIKLRPTTFVKLTESAPAEIDVTALFYFQDKFWVGPMFRSGDALGLLAGLNITNQFSFGYSFDWSVANKTGKYNAGSHEIMLRYDFIFRNKQKVRSPRYF